MKCEIVSFAGDPELLKQAACVYYTVWDRNPSDSLSFFRKYARAPQYRGFVAQVDGEVVGVAFGARSKRGDWWHDKVADHVGEAHPALQNAWVLIELAVLEDYRRQQIGGQLHDHILKSQPLSNLLLSTQVNNVGARRFYERRGWSYLHPGFAFQPGGIWYVIMQKKLGS